MELQTVLDSQQRVLISASAVPRRGRLTIGSLKQSPSMSTQIRNLKMEEDEELGEEEEELNN